MRLRLYYQRTAIWKEKFDAAHWIRTGNVRASNAAPPEDDPAVKIAQEQIRKDGRLIVENVTKAVEEWQPKTSKPAEPT